MEQRFFDNNCAGKMVICFLRHPTLLFLHFLRFSIIHQLGVAAHVAIEAQRNARKQAIPPNNRWVAGAGAEETQSISLTERSLHLNGWFTSRPFSLLGLSAVQPVFDKKDLTGYKQIGGIVFPLSRCLSCTHSLIQNIEGMASVHCSDGGVATPSLVATNGLV